MLSGCLRNTEVSHEEHNLPRAGSRRSSCSCDSRTAFVVDQAEQAIIVQLGEPVGDVITDPGLHWRLPFIQDVAPLRQAPARLGRRREPNTDARPRVHHRRHHGAMADHRSAAVPAIGARRGRRPHAARRRPRLGGARRRLGHRSRGDRAIGGLASRRVAAHLGGRGRARGSGPPAAEEGPRTAREGHARDGIAADAQHRHRDSGRADQADQLHRIRRAVKSKAE